MRKLARTVAANMSYRRCGTTDMRDYYFNKIWRENGGHPRGKRWRNPTKPMFARALVKAKNKLARIARRLNRKK